MKKISKLLLLLLFAGIVESSKSQTSFLPIDTLPGHEFCGATPEYAQKMNILRTQLQDGQNPTQTSPYKYVIQAAFPPALIEQCGSFNVYYEDYLTAPEGFAAPSGS